MFNFNGKLIKRRTVLCTFGSKPVLTVVSGLSRAEKQIEAKNTVD